MRDSAMTQKSVEFLLADSKRRVAVVSGPKGLTDLYITAAQQRIVKGSVDGDLYDKIMGRWQEICSRLELKGEYDSIKREFDKILESYGARSRNLSDLRARRFIDNVARLGEYFEAKYVFTPFLEKLGKKALFLDPKDLIVGTDVPGDASIIQELTTEKVKENILDKDLLDSYDVLVMPGYYCYSKEGHLVTLPRGGSDTTGAAVAHALNASIYENVTNNRVRRAQPEIFEDAPILDRLTYSEGTELTFMGFGILTPEAIEPCQERTIPIHVIDIDNPHEATVILRDRRPDKFDITGVAYKPGFGDITIRTGLRHGERISSIGDYIREVEHGGSSLNGKFPVVYPIPSVSGISFVVEGRYFTDENVHNAVRYLRESLGLHDKDIEVSHNTSLISIVGQDMQERRGIRARATGAIARAGVSITHGTGGASDNSFILGVRDYQNPGKAIRAATAVYREFFVDPDVGRRLDLLQS